MEDFILGYFFHAHNGTVDGSPPSLTTRARELVSILEVRIKPAGLEPVTSDSEVCHSTNSATSWHANISILSLSSCLIICSLVNYVHESNVVEFDCT